MERIPDDTAHTTTTKYVPIRRDPKEGHEIGGQTARKTFGPGRVIMKIKPFDDVMNDD